MSEYRALCRQCGTCIVCGEPPTDTHMNQAHAAPIIAKAMKDYKDGLWRGEEDTDYSWKPLSEHVLANIAKVSPSFVLAYKRSVHLAKIQLEREEWEGRVDSFED